MTGSNVGDDHGRFSPFRPEAVQDPHAAYRRLREVDPVYWDERLGAWILTRYGDCRQVLADHHHFACDWRRVGVPAFESAISLQTLDPPELAPVNDLITSGLKACDYGALADTIASHASDLLTDLAQREEFDFVTQFARPITVAATSAVLGVDPEELSHLDELSDAVMTGMDAALAQQPGRVIALAAAARQELSERILRWLQAESPSGLMGYLSLVERENAHIATPVVIGSVRTVLLGLFESWGNLLSSAAWNLLHPRRLLDGYSERRISTTAIHELIRLSGPLQTSSRAVVGHVRLGAHEFKHGSVVVTINAAANRDPSVFANPDELQLGRRPNPHLGFGLGAHYCLGAPFVLRLTPVVLREVAVHAHRFSVAEGPVWKARVTIQGAAHMRIRVKQ